MVKHTALYRCLLLAATLVAPCSGFAQIYKWVDQNGATHYGSRPPTNTKVSQLDAQETGNPQSQSTDALTGSWKIVQMGKDKEPGTSFWEFHQGRFTHISFGSRLPSDRYTIQGNTIDLGYSKITVLSNDGATLRARWAGVDYVLTKASDVADRTPKSQQSLSPEAKKIAQGFADGILNQVDMSAKLDCAKSVKNTRDSADSMIGMIEKNHLDGYLDKAQHDKAVSGIRTAANAITMADCQAAQGKKKDFYQCMSSDKNLFAACAKAHRF